MSNETPAQPKLGDLLGRLLQNQASAHREGLAVSDLDALVQPFEAGPVQPVDATLAWEEAQAALRYFVTPQPLSLYGRGETGPQAPPNWPTLVASQEPALALAFCVGNFPQLVRNFHMILQSANLAQWIPTAARPISAPAYEEWARGIVAQRRFPDALLALGALRLANQVNSASGLVTVLEPHVPQEWTAAWENEKAALLWHRGQTQQARNAWRRQTPSVPVLFNRGMSDLFLGEAAAARKSLEQAVKQLPETSAWHHLARLYLVLASGSQSLAAD
ncbi:MAG: hypothetical protein HY040_05915 [Planctomycetes bacterium]|nr:hypothetical protein [Planctomycetota bacterium]